MREVRERQRHRQADDRAEERNEVEDAEREADEKAVRKPHQPEARAVHHALDEADDRLPLEEADEDADEKVDLIGDESPGLGLQEGHLGDDFAAAAVLCHQEEDEEDERHECRDDARQALERARPRLESRRPVLRVDLAEVVIGHAHLREKPVETRERRLKPVHDLLRQRRRLRHQVGHLVDQHGARIPEEKPERHEHRRQHDDERQGRIAHAALEPLIVGLEEKRQEEAEDNRHHGRRGERQDLQENPRRHGHKRDRERQRQDRQSRRNRLPLTIGELNHAAYCIRKSRTWGGPRRSVSRRQ